MQIFYTPIFEKLFYKLPKKNQKKAKKKIELFKENPFNPILKIEKLIVAKKEFWSFRIDRSYRIIFKFENNKLVFHFIGHHSCIYRVI